MSGTIPSFPLQPAVAVASPTATSPAIVEGRTLHLADYIAEDIAPNRPIQAFFLAPAGAMPETRE
ncbi:MAG TPA: hypothetical protein VGL86_17200 [Polyangia bacterium]|jgi:hypothetical protein